MSDVLTYEDVKKVLDNIEAADERRFKEFWLETRGVPWEPKYFKTWDDLRKHLLSKDSRKRWRRLK